MINKYCVVPATLFLFCTCLPADDISHKSEDQADRVIDTFINLGLLHDRGLALTGFYEPTNKWLGDHFLFVDNKIIPLSKEIQSSLKKETLGNLRRSDKLSKNRRIDSSGPGEDSKVTLLAFAILNEAERSTLRALLLHREGLLALSRKLFVEKYRITNQQLREMKNTTKQNYDDLSLPIHRAIFSTKGIETVNYVLALRKVSKLNDDQIAEILTDQQRSLLVIDINNSVKLTKKIGFNESYLSCHKNTD